MRTIRNFVVLLILLFFLIDAAPVLAVDSLFTVPGCDDITKPCQTTGDGVNTVIPLNKTETIIANTAAKLLGPQNIITKLFGSLRPLDSYHIGSENLTSFANQIQSASDFELNPAALQSLEQHDKASKSASMTSRECVYDPKTGVLVADIVSSDTIITGDVPWIRPAVEGSRRLSSFTTGFVQESQDYRLPDIKIKQDAALPCGSQLSGQTKKQDSVSFQFQNTYGSAGTNKILSFIYNVTADMIKLFTNENGETQAKAEIPATASIVGTGQSPFTGHAAALSAGCATGSDLSAVSYATDEQKKKLCAAGGFVNSMYRPDSIDATYKSQLNAKDETQQWEQTITGSNPVAPNSNAFAARVEAAGIYTNCTLNPAGIQGPECNQNWAGPATATGDCSSDTTGQFTLDANVTEAIQTATQGKMPACVIEGVKVQESGFSWNENNQCTINECGAVGPFQISVGISGSGDPYCKQCNAHFATGQYRCNSEWINNWPTDPTKPNPCDLKLAAERITYLIQNKAKNYSKTDLGSYQEIKPDVPVGDQRDVIIMAGNRYLGSYQPIHGNCSYGELLYKHCDPTYCCGSHNISFGQ